MRPAASAARRHFSFTQRAIAALQPDARQGVEYYDVKTPGLAVRVHPTGKKTFCLNYRLPHHRQSTRWKLGHFPSLTVEEARAKVVTANKQLQDGIDPNPAHAAPTPPAMSRVLFGTLAERYLEQHAKVKKKSWKQDQGWITLYLRPAWQDTPLAEIRRRQVADLLNTITHERHAPRASDVVRSLISRMFRFGIANGYEEIEYNPASGTERALDTIPKRTRYPDDQHPRRSGEFKRLWRSGTSGLSRGGRSSAGNFSCAP